MARRKEGCLQPVVEQPFSKSAGVEREVTSLVVHYNVAWRELLVVLYYLL
jgi:hypothetical protein